MRIMRERRRLPSLLLPALLLALLLALPLAAAAQEGWAENRFYYNQLDADERAVYEALQAQPAPRTMDPVSVRVYFPESTTRYSSTDFINTAIYAYQYDNPAEAAWIGGVFFRQSDGEDVPFEQLCIGTPDRLPAYDSLILEVHPACTADDLFLMDQYLEGLTDMARAGMSRYDRAAYIQERTVANLRYDHDRRYDNALVSSPMCITVGYAICEGFSKVYKAVADKLSLPCVLSMGENHMYVQVQMEDGGWYIVEPQGDLLLAGTDRVRGNAMYYPQQPVGHWENTEGHGAVSLPPVPANSWQGQNAPPAVNPPIIDPPTVNPPVPADDSLPAEMGVPQLNGRRFGRDSMNIAVYWVQVQLKATGTYYTGDQWDETGNLGDHTQDEIKRFMRDRGHAGHDGCVDQAVVDELAAYLGGRLRPVMRGGWYRHMNTLLDDTQWESMTNVVLSSKDGSSRNAAKTRWVQTCLSMLGYYKGSVDGSYGSGTESAVKAFQRDHGFQQRSYVTYGVARAMLEACEQRGCDLNRLP